MSKEILDDINYYRYAKSCLLGVVIHPTYFSHDVGRNLRSLCSVECHGDCMTKVMHCFSNAESAAVKCCYVISICRPVSDDNR